MRTTRLALFVALLAADLAPAAPSVPGAPAPCVQDDQEPAREGTSSELDPLVLAYEFQKATGDSPRIAAAVRAFHPFKNASLLGVVRESLEHEPLRADEKAVDGELDEEERDDERLVEQLVWQRAALVVAAGAELAVRMGSRESLDELERALGGRVVRDNPLARTAVLDALTRHPNESTKATKRVQALVLGFDGAPFDANGWAPHPHERAGTPCLDAHLAALRYVARWGTRERDVATELAELLCDAERKGVARDLERKGEAWRGGRTAAAAAAAPLAVEALQALTGERFTDDAPGRERALAWLDEHGAGAGLK